MKKFWLCLGLLVSMPFLQGSAGGCLGLGPVTRSVDKLTATLQSAIDTLGAQSSAWQGTLANLEHQVAADSEEVAGQVAALAKEGINFAGTDIQCRSDIVGKHMRAGLQNVVHRLRHEAEELIPPSVCHVEPDHLDLGRPPALLRFWGADLNKDAQRPQAYILDAAGTETPVPPSLISRESDYAMTLTVGPLVGAQLTATSRQIIFKWQNEKVNQNEVPVVQPCGEVSQVCCSSGGACRAGVCIGGTCRPCGELGQSCCSANQCRTGACQNGSCVAPPEQVRSLVVKLRTGNLENAGTDDNVTLYLGLNKWNLDIGGDYDDRERGHTDTYVLTPGSNLRVTSELNPVKIVKSADGDNGGWYFAGLEIQVNGRTLYSVTVNQWIEDRNLVWVGSIPNLP